jgi:hypothetical protein
MDNDCGPAPLWHVGPVHTCRQAVRSMLLALVTMVGLAGCQHVEELYQHDADIVRARHLVEWAQIIETYHSKAGRYPLQSRAKGDETLLVQIATREQQEYLDPGSSKYAKGIDNKVPRFTSVSVKDFVADIEAVLGRDIDERYDPQRVPTGAPIYLSYFVNRDGYLIWTVCRTCPPRSNSFSTLLWTATPSINIGSKWFIENVRKTQSITSLQANEEFVAFVGNGPTRMGWFAHLEHEQAHESKK